MDLHSRPTPLSCDLGWACNSWVRLPEFAARPLSRMDILVLEYLPWSLAAEQFLDDSFIQVHVPCLPAKHDIIKDVDCETIQIFSVARVQS